MGTIAGGWEAQAAGSHPWSPALLGACLPIQHAHGGYVDWPQSMVTSPVEMGNPDDDPNPFLVGYLDGEEQANSPTGSPLTPKSNARLCKDDNL